MKELPDLVGMAEVMLEAANKGEIKEVERIKNLMGNVKGIYQNLIEQGYSSQEIISGAYLKDKTEN